MQATYKMIGADGVEYGPVSLKELQSWVTEGRVVGSTQVRRDTDPFWSTASSIEELGVTDRVPGTPSEPEMDLAEAGHIEKRIKSGGSWLYWIAALTLVNSIVTLAGSEWSFVLGLSVTQVIDAAVAALAPKEISVMAKIIAFGVDSLAIGLFVFLGFQAGRKRIWAFAIGIALYGVDTLLTLLSLSMVSIGIHGWALLCLSLGMKAAQQWKKLGYVERPAAGAASLASQSLAALPPTPSER
jgi:hypothetical protein